LGSQSITTMLSPHKNREEMITGPAILEVR
jgi:hypothetical protein